MIDADAHEVARRRQRVRLYRFAGNVMFYIAPAALLLALVRWLVPTVSRDVMLALWIPFGFAALVMAAPWVVAQCCFMFGLIKCPSCNDRYGRGITSYVGTLSCYIGSRCKSCGTDIRRG